jgi:serine protease inhibitor
MGTPVFAKSEVDMNDFACAMYAQLRLDQPPQDAPDQSQSIAQKNLFFSPFSMRIALLMSAEGARAETALQMGAALQLPSSSRRADVNRPWDLATAHASVAALARRLAGKPVPTQTREQLQSLRAALTKINTELDQSPGYGAQFQAQYQQAQALAEQINILQKQVDQYEFRSAHALWLEQSFALQPEFVTTLKQYYGSELTRPLDFLHHPEPSRISINHWVSAQTNQRINNLIGPGIVDASTRLVLSNAVYFLGEWSEPFAIADTRNEKFQLANGSSVNAALMQAYKSEGVKYAAFHADGASFATPLRINSDARGSEGHYPKAGFQVLELPYRGDSLSMLLILPSKNMALATLEAQLSGANLRRWSTFLAAREVKVAIPKFKLENSYELSDALQRLGMRRAFVNPTSANSAQFDGMSASADPSKRLYIGAVVHKAFVEVHEKGTEAAAATAVAVAAGAAIATTVPFIPSFRADHGFVFVIRDTQTETVLFMGRLLDPR